MVRAFIKKPSGQILGPFESHQLKTMVADGSLVQNDELAKTTDGPWKPASQLKGLFEVPEQQSFDGTVGNQSDNNQKEAIQNLVHAIAEELRNGRKKGEVTQDLVDNGWDQAEASDFVNHIDSNLSQLQADHSEDNSGMRWLIWIGVLLLINLLSYLFNWPFWVY